jgi:hypothetical protein
VNQTGETTTTLEKLVVGSLGMNSRGAVTHRGAFDGLIRIISISMPSLLPAEELISRIAQSPRSTIIVYNTTSEFAAPPLVASSATAEDIFQLNPHLTRQRAPNRFYIADFETNSLGHAKIADTHSLARNYVLENPTAVENYVKRYRLQSVLNDAIRPLNSVFGEGSIRTLALITDDEGNDDLVCTTRFSGDAEHALAALERFDRDWWRTQPRNEGSSLVFDVEFA